jgi:hypothetical protein
MFGPSANYWKALARFRPCGTPDGQNGGIYDLRPGSDVCIFLGRPLLQREQCLLKLPIEPFKR